MPLRLSEAEFLKLTYKESKPELITISAGDIPKAPITSCWDEPPVDVLNTKADIKGGICLTVLDPLKSKP